MRRTAAPWSRRRTNSRGSRLRPSGTIRLERRRLTGRKCPRRNFLADPRVSRESPAMGCASRSVGLGDVSTYRARFRSDPLKSCVLSERPHARGRARFAPDQPGHPSHRFWKDDIPFTEAVQAFASNLVGHRQATDAYLLGLAIHNKGKPVTLDRAILTLLPEKSAERESVVVI